MSKSINVVFIKQRKQDTEGTVTIRTIENRIVEKRSLKIKISESQWNKYFNPETQRFRKSKVFTKSEEFNNKIEENLNELRNYGGEISNIPNNKKSFIKYWGLCIKNFTNHGTSIKHETILKKLRKYLSYINKSDLLFKDITPIFLKEFRNYLTTVKDPKILSENTVIHYLKVIKSIINQSTKDDYYTYIKNPFNSVKFNVEKRSKSVLNEDQIDRLLKTIIKDNNLLRTRDMFLFQVFSNGMRVSDLFLLRWNNIINNRIIYTMFKTGTVISIPLNLNIGIVFSELLDNLIKYDEVVRKEKISFEDEEEGFFEIGLDKLNKFINSLLNPKITYNPLVNKFMNEEKRKVDKNMGKIIDYKGYSIKQFDKRIKNYIDLQENLVRQIETEFMNLLSVVIKEKKETNGNDFIFPVLSNKEFKDIDSKNDFSKLSLKQYNSIKHHTIVYNRKLKKVQELCGIETNITSHVSRHSFTNLLLRLENVNLYDVSQSLGHSSIKITENYLRTGFNIDKIDYLNNSISRRYRRSK